MSGTPGPAALPARIPSLDGLRAISILFVIVGHFQESVEEHLAPSAVTLLQFVNRGDFGVAVFFVISGFLITWLLLQEENRTGGIDLLAFYQRRAYRIWPAFYTYVGVITVLALVGVIAVSWQAVVVASAFLWNYVSTAGDGWWLGHSWSLAVEEQFYLLWPACLLLWGRRGGLRVAIAMIALAPVIRVVSYFLMPTARPLIGVMLHTRADSLMFGCLLAMLLADPRTTGFVRRLVASRVHLPALLLLLVAAPLLQAGFGAKYLLPIGWSLEALCIAIVVAVAVLEPGTRMGRFLNGRVITAIGLRSYSLYLWQQFFAHDVPGLPDVPLVVRLAGMVVAAELSYRAIELPMLALRQRRQARGRRVAVVHPAATADVTAAAP